VAAVRGPRAPLRPARLAQRLSKPKRVIGSTRPKAPSTAFSGQYVAGTAVTGAVASKAGAAGIGGGRSDRRFLTSTCPSLLPEARMPAPPLSSGALRGSEAGLAGTRGWGRGVAGGHRWREQKRATRSAASP